MEAAIFIGEFTTSSGRLAEPAARGLGGIRSRSAAAAAAAAAA
jgi:hypothetical protein